MCQQKEKCNRCGVEYKFICQECGKQMMCTPFCTNNSSSQWIYTFCGVICQYQFNHFPKTTL